MLQRRLAGFCVDHMHIRDLLRSAFESPRYDVVGVFDPDPVSMGRTCAELPLPPHDQFTDWERLLAERKPDVGVVCSVTADHALWCERLADAGVHVILEKPFATSAMEAERCVRATSAAGITLAINWPLAWHPSHRTTRRLIADGAIGDVLEVHYYDGNRGPTHQVRAGPGRARTWWFDEAAGGGSMLDYLGYGVTLATWFRGGELPIEVTAVTHEPPAWNVDSQSIVVARYPIGLSTFQTRWGTFTDPWVHQPLPACGFTVVGSRGTILSLDHAEMLRLQSEDVPEGHDVPVEYAAPGDRNILEAFNAALACRTDLEGPAGWMLSLAAQRIVDAAVASARSHRPVRVLVEDPRLSAGMSES